MRTGVIVVTKPGQKDAIWESEDMSEQKEGMNDMDTPSRVSRFLSLRWLPNISWLRRVIVAVIGFTVLLIGIAMIVLPGPAIIVIPLGLAILATEFLWARRLLSKSRNYFEKAKKKALRKRSADR